MRIWFLLAAVMLCLTACGRTPEAAIPATEPADPVSATIDGTEPVRPQLMARADSRETAEEIARQYGITLVRYRSGLAAFYTEEDPVRVLERRQENWPELYLNHISHTS